MSTRKKRLTVIRTYPGEPKQMRTVVDTEPVAVEDVSDREETAPEPEAMTVPKMTLHPDVIRQLPQTNSTAIFEGLKENSVLPNAQVIETPIPINNNDEIESAVQGSVAGALRNLTGEASPNTDLDKPGLLFNSVSVPIVPRVSERSKQKYWHMNTLILGYCLTTYQLIKVISSLSVTTWAAMLLC